MNSPQSSSRPWTPVTDRDRSLVREELEEVIRSPQFCNSKRYPALLRYVVETTLAGHADLLKERTLGVEVFHRSPSYDTNTDTVVRYTAGEVRKRLIAFYHARGASPVQIALPSGSYVPEFLLSPGEETEAEPAQTGSVPGSAAGDPRSSTAQPPASAPVRDGFRAGAAQPVPQARTPGRWSPGRRLALLLVPVLLAATALTAWRHSSPRPNDAVHLFWAPLLAQPGQTVLCVGGVTFAENNFSGVHTAGKDTPYPFASMQIVSSVSQISGLLERGGATYGVRAAASTQLSELREHPLVLIGGYNNQWTMQLLSPLRFHFSPEPVEAIVDTEHPGTSWVRDRSQPYGSADDYALLARFRDNITGSMVVAAAGLGRNGTELASQFLTSEDSMQQLQAKLGGRLATANLEVVLRARVIDGRTGAPHLEAVYEW